MKFSFYCILLFAVMLRDVLSLIVVYPQTLYFAFTGRQERVWIDYFNPKNTSMHRKKTFED